MDDALLQVHLYLIVSIKARAISHDQDEQENSWNQRKEEFDHT